MLTFLFQKASSNGGMGHWVLARDNLVPKQHVDMGKDFYGFGLSLA